MASNENSPTALLLAADRPSDGALLDSVTLARLLRVPERTLDQWAYRGVGPRYVKVGRYRRYRQADVDVWLTANERGGAA